MTDEEMAEQFADNISGLELTCSLLAAKDKSHAYRLGRYEGFLAGLKAGRPQWHDLRKDPNDLPKEDRYYLIYTVLGNYYVSKHHHNTNYWIGIQNQFVSIKQVIAWCEIPTFDKE